MVGLKRWSDKPEVLGSNPIPFFAKERSRAYPKESNSEPIGEIPSGPIQTIKNNYIKYILKYTYLKLLLHKITMFPELILVTVLSVYSLTLFSFINKFRIKRRHILVFMVPFSFFTIGYYLRLSGIQETTDLGFFLTDSSFLFVYILFSFFLMLGQLKYWKKS